MRDGDLFLRQGYPGMGHEDVHEEPDARRYVAHGEDRAEDDGDHEDALVEGQHDAGMWKAT